MIEIFQNIRENYDFIRPCEELAEFVEFFSESSPSATGKYVLNGYSHSKMFSSWTPTFYINLGSPYLINLDTSRFSIGADQDILILRNGDVTRYKLPTDRLFTVKFFPGALEAVLGIPQAGLCNQVTNLQEVLPPLLLHTIKIATGFNERVSIMQNFLLKEKQKYCKKDHYLKIVRDAIGEYHATGMQLNTSQVAERLFVSSKSINRYFHKVVGVSPKAYFSIVRTRAALTAFIKDKKHFDPSIFGYYDSSHFSKDVFSFTGHRLNDQL